MRLALPGIPKRLVPFALAGVLGIMAVVVFEQYRRQLVQQLNAERQKLYADYQQASDVIVATKDIAGGKVIAADEVGISAIPGKFIQPYATSNTADVVGLIAAAPMAQGEQVLTNKLRRPNELPIDATLSGLTPEGKRAVTIASDALHGVGGFIRPGDRVDILWTVKLPREQGGDDPVTLALFQDVGVLAVGNEIVGRSTSEKESSPDYTVTLALSPQETSLLLYAREQGVIQLSLHSRANKGGPVAIPPMSSAAAIASVMGNTPQPTGQAKQRTVEVYKGLERSVVSVNE